MNRNISKLFFTEKMLFVKKVLLLVNNAINVELNTLSSFLFMNQKADIPPFMTSERPCCKPYSSCIGKLIYRKRKENT